jgi:Protein tyrosine and serine/threonine kinase
MAVREHLQTSVQRANLYGQGSADKGPPVTKVPFADIWTATSGFDSECAPRPASQCLSTVVALRSCSRVSVARSAASHGSWLVLIDSCRCGAVQLTAASPARRGLLFEDAYGKVFQADVLGGVHAIRVLNASLYSPPALASHLSAVAAVQHAHIVSLKGAVQDRGILVTDLPEAGNALYLVQTGTMPSKEPLQWNNCVDIALAVASALEFMHNRPSAFAHGGLTAASVLIDRNGVAKVSDAGLFALTSHEPPRTEELLVKDLHSLGARSHCTKLLRVTQARRASGGVAVLHILSTSLYTVGLRTTEVLGGAHVTAPCRRARAAAAYAQHAARRCHDAAQGRRLRRRRQPHRRERGARLARRLRQGV